MSAPIGTLWNVYETDGLPRLDVRRADYLAPFFRFGDHEVREFRGRGRKWLIPGAGNLCLPFSVGQSSIDLLVKLFEDGSWRAPCCADPMPPACLVTWQKLGNSRHVRQQCRTTCARDSERAQAAGLD